jgi:plasma-membrane proton-efflux P-type ATPase
VQGWAVSRRLPGAAGKYSGGGKLTHAGTLARCATLADIVAVGAAPDHVWRLAVNTPDGPLHSARPDIKTGLSSAEAKSRLERDGPNDVPEKKSHPLLSLARKFWGLSAWMLELIAALSFVLGKTADFWIAVALLVVNAALSFLQEQRASAAVAALRRQLQVTARVLRDGRWTSLPARELVCGDVIRVRTGDFVPADAEIAEGALRIDQSALTGESQELSRTTNETVYSGSVVRRGEASGVVTATGTRTYFGLTTELVEHAEPKLHIEEVISRVVKWLFAIVSIMVATTLIVSIAWGLRLVEILPLSLILLMSAIPVALPVMFTVSMAVGSIELARRGVLVSRLSAAEDAANLDILCADKTGTLTLNRLSLVRAIAEPPFTEDDVIRNGALASNEANQDVIDLAFLRAAKERGLSGHGEQLVSFTPFSAETRRTEARILQDGRPVRIIKGALRTIAELAGAGPEMMVQLEARAQAEAQKGFRILAVARAEEDGPLRIVGLALLSDPPRADSRELIADLRSLGVAVKMLTGDALPVARQIARDLGLGDIAAAPRPAAGQSAAQVGVLIRGHDGLAEIFPEDKFLVVKGLQAGGHVVAMTGDGVNDAPALRQAEVGIAVSGATDVAKGAASVVLITEGLTGIVELVRNGRVIYQRVLTWIINKISRTILKSGFVVLPFLATGKFVISALGMVLVVFMTDFAKIALSTDRARPSSLPETWNIGPLVWIAAILGVLMLIEALALLAFAWRQFDLAHDAGRLQTFAFQTLLFFAIFSILSVRERRAFWASLPSAVLTLALCLDAAAGLLIGTHGLAELKPLPMGETAVIVGYACLFSLVVNDFIKVALMARYRPAAR